MRQSSKYQYGDTAASGLGVECNTMGTWGNGYGFPGNLELYESYDSAPYWMYEQAFDGVVEDGDD